MSLTEGVEVRSLTFGEKAVGINFNPSEDPTVNEVKQLYARIIDIADQQRLEAGPGQKARHLSTAITDAETAQMRLVRGLTFKD